MVQHVYDIIWHYKKNEDTLVVIDDNSIEGTTLKRSIIRMLNRLNKR
jgi:amidophosphoribosyltransferase